MTELHNTTMACSLLLFLTDKEENKHERIRGNHSRNLYTYDGRSI